MHSRPASFPRARALAAGVAAASCFATAGPALAASPNGTACQAGGFQGDPNGGKVSGSGSTFQIAAIKSFIDIYQSDLCGVVATQYTGDPAGNTMIAYDYSGAGTGSGKGLRDAACRQDSFGGTDTPYNENTLHNQLNVDPATNGYACATTYPAPFTPTPPTKTGAANPAMVFPVAGGATAIGFNLGATSCPAPATPPTALSFTSAEMDGINQGTINKWNDAVLVANNPGLTGCTGTIQRVVSNADSITTGQYMTYLNHINSAVTCDGVNTWAALAAKSPNTTWPTGPNCKDANNNVAPAVLGKSGTIGIINCVQGVLDTGAGCGDGAIGYGELGVWGANAPSAKLASLQSAASAGVAPVYVTPGSGTSGSNCSFLANGGLPGSKSASDSVSLNGVPKGSGNSNWASDAPINRSDFTYVGSGYPVCGLTWDVVYTNLHLTNGATGDPFPGLTQNQRQTLYSFFSYALTAQGQSGLNAAGYDPLPAGWLPTIRAGFQNNF